MLDDALVLDAGGLPEPRQLLDVVVGTLDRILVHEPDHFHLGVFDRARNEAVDHAVVGIGQKVADGADVEVGRIAVVPAELSHQARDPPAIRRCAVEALVEGAAKYRYRFAARRGVLTVLIDVGNHDAEGRGAPATGCFDRLALRRRPGVNVALGELRMRRLAVVALHVVFDGELPVRADRVGLAVRDLRLRPAVDARAAGERGLRRRKIERLRRERRKDESLHHPHRQ